MNFHQRIYTLFIYLIVTNFAKAQYYDFDRVDSVKIIKNSSELPFPWVGGLNAVQFSSIDLNDDGTDDLFLFDRTGNKILTFINNNGIYSYAPEYENQFPELNYWALLRDYNCDGKKDIFSYVSGGIGVWKNTSNGNSLSFTKVTSPYIESQQYNTTTNLFVSKVDIPAIDDIDNDGDLDILTFGVLGSRIEYHKNMRSELNYDCDSIIYELKNSCWGHFYESTVSPTNTCVLFDTCSANSNVNNPEKQTPLKHTGSTILSLDLNNDGVRDLLLGDVSFNNIVALYNDNSGVNLNTSMVSQDTLFPNYNTPVDLNIFPATFYEDVDNDGIKDLIASPNIQDYSDNSYSVWFYKNTGSNTSPVFNFIESNFLQKDMIDYGRSAYPVLFDYNNDGLLDLFISSFGSYNPSVTGNYISKIALYENTGSASLPEFTLVTEDFENLYNLNMGKALYPVFSDLDNDSDFDLVIGNYGGKVLFLENTGNSPSSYSFSSFSYIQDDNGNDIDVGAAAKPTLFDLDNDGDLDLIIGEERGNLNYYENVGTSSAFSFRLQSQTFGGVEVSEWWTTIGNSVPYFTTGDNNEIQLLVGSEKGDIFHYDNINNNLSGTFAGKDTLKTINLGPEGTPTFGNLNNDAYLDLIIGNERGGISLFYGKEGSAPTSITENDKTNINWSIFPNPSHDFFTIKSNILITSYKIYDLTGRIVEQNKSQPGTINCSTWNKGFYIIQIDTPKGSYSHKIIIK